MRCTICKEEKPETEFPVRNKAKGEYQRFCKVCKRPYARAWYARHKSEQIPRVKSTMKLRKDKLRELVRSMKSSPCSDCGWKKHWFLMEYDRRDNTKVMDVSRMIQRGFSEESVLTEIAKCDLVCVECHRIRTWNRTATESERIPQRSP